MLPSGKHTAENVDGQAEALARAHGLFEREGHAAVAGHADLWASRNAGRFFAAETRVQDKIGRQSDGEDRRGSQQRTKAS